MKKLAQFVALPALGLLSTGITGCFNQAPKSTSQEITNQSLGGGELQQFEKAPDNCPESIYTISQEAIRCAREEEIERLKKSSVLALNTPLNSTSYNLDKTIDGNKIQSGNFTKGINDNFPLVVSSTNSEGVRKTVTTVGVSGNGEILERRFSSISDTNSTIIEINPVSVEASKTTTATLETNGSTTNRYTRTGFVIQNGQLSALRKSVLPKDAETGKVATYTSSTALEDPRRGFDANTAGMLNQYGK